LKKDSVAVAVPGVQLGPQDDGLLDVGGALHGRISGLRLEEFEAVAPGVFGVETADAGERVVVSNLDAANEQGLAQFVEVGYDEGGMSFSGGEEMFFDADVELLRTALEPAAAARAERLGLLDFGQAEERAIKFAGGGFATLRSGDLKVIEVCDTSFHGQYKIPARRRTCVRKKIIQTRGTK
jgi:hypothetical protein